MVQSASDAGSIVSSGKFLRYVQDFANGLSLPHPGSAANRLKLSRDDSEMGHTLAPP